MTEDTYRGRLNDPLSLNRYTYCHNEPIMYWDPTGYSALKKGSSGSDVKELQKELQKAGYKIDADGKFGPKTEAAVKDYQQKKGLAVDGIVGDKTKSSMGLATDKGTQSSKDKISKPSTPTPQPSQNKSTTDAGKSLSTKDKTDSTKDKIQETGKTGSQASTADRIVSVAKEELVKGFKENNGDNKTPYGKWYGLDGQPWCAMFVSYTANEAGVLATKESPKGENGDILAPAVPKFASVRVGVEWYKTNARFESKTSGYEPKAGDIIFFTNKGQNHVGIVTAIDTNTKTVYTIEGNSSNAVAQRKYSLDNTVIVGYGKNGGTSNGTIPQNATSGAGQGTR